MYNDLKDNLFNAIMYISDIVWCFKVDSLEIIYTNESFNNSFVKDASKEINLKESFFNNIHPNDLSLFHETIQDAIRNDYANSELTIFDVYNTSKNFKIELFCFKNENGVPEILVGLGVESTFEKIGNVSFRTFGDETLSILDNIRDSYISLDIDGNVTFANKTFKKFINKDKSQLYGLNIFQLFPDAINTNFETNYNRSVSEKVSIEFEEYLPSIKKWLSIITYPNLTGMSVFIHDITKKKKNSEILEQSEKKFHLMSDNSPMFIWTSDENNVYTFFNKTFIDFTGLNSEKLISEGWHSLLHPSDKEQVFEEWEKSLSDKVSFFIECKLLRFDNDYRWVRLNGTPQIDGNGDFTGFLINGIDITDLKFYYEKLEEKNVELEFALNESRRLSGILNKTTNILVLTDVEGKITWVNEAFTKYTEYTLEEVLGKKPGPLVYGPETSLETMNILHDGIQKREITRVEILNYSKSGNKFWLDVRIEPIFNNGIPEGYMAIEIDITKRKKDELAIKERNEKIKEFSFITSHDLRHEFAKIMMLLNLAKSQENSIDDYQTLFKHLESPVSRINSIISKINTNLYIGDSNHNLEERLNEMEEIREICLVDDDELTNLIHKQIIKIILPKTPIRVYEDIDTALNYFKIQPHDSRLVFLDLNFHTGRSGWDFLDEYEKLGIQAPVIILSSSIDKTDLDKSKHYKCVLEYLIKPLTAEILHKYIKKIA